MRNLAPYHIKYQMNQMNKLQKEGYSYQDAHDIIYGKETNDELPIMLLILGIIVVVITITLAVS